jgi:hypothetical protein
MEIKIERPFRLHFDVIEIDEMIPSMKVLLEVGVHQFSHDFHYRGHVWFECAAWDSFVEGLVAGEVSPSLVDMEGDFSFKIDVFNSPKKLLWQMRRHAIDGTVAVLSCDAPIDDELVAQIKREFSQFERWWGE